MTIKRIRFLQEFLKFMGLGGRLHLEWISSAEAQKFVQVVTEFTEKIRALGPSPIAIHIEKMKAMGPRLVLGFPAEAETWILHPRVAGNREVQERALGA
jgi:F420-non-reducing hydrogenase iron-sulfur subunit